MDKNINMIEATVINLFDDPPAFRAQLIKSNQIRPDLLELISIDKEEDPLVREAARNQLNKVNHHKNKEVAIDQIDFDHCIINNKKYESLCWYLMDNEQKDSVSIYFNSEKDMTIIFNEHTENAKALIDSFSMNEPKELMDFIEATKESNKKSDIICSNNYFDQMLVQSIKLGGYYPKICNSNCVDSNISILNKKNASYLKRLQTYFHKKSEDLSTTIEKDLVSASYENKKFFFDDLKDNPFTEDEDVDFIEYENPQSLPEGWKWLQYNDGSGHLKSPNDTSYFSYEAAIRPGEFEYKITNKERWNTFYGSFDEFKNFAESLIKENYLKDYKKETHNLENRLEVATEKVSENTNHIPLPSIEKTDNIER